MLMLHMIWGMTELSENFKQCFPLYKKQHKTSPFFCPLVLRWLIIHICMPEFLCIGGWGKHKTIAWIYIFSCFLNFRGKYATLICWPFLIFWKMHSRWKFAGKNFRLTQLEMFKHSTQWSSRGKIGQTFYVSGNMRLYWNYQTGSKCHTKSRFGNCGEEAFSHS